MRRFRSSDLEEMNRWYAARGIAPLTPDELGEVGFIVPGVAAGFLLRTEARGVAMIDAIVTNPDAKMRVNYRAVRGIIEALERKAREMGVKRLGGFTRSSGVERVGRALGFSLAGAYNVLRKEL